MEIRKGYKQTDIGIIPEDWDTPRIDNVCKLINGRGFKPFEWKTTGLPIIRIQNLNGSDEYNYFNGTYDKKLEVETGQLLFAWSGSRGTSFGPHIWHGSLGVLNYHTWKVQIYDTLISKQFFLYALRHLIGFIEGQAHGAAALVHVQKWEMESFLFPLPPSIPEQEAIVTVLSDVDTLLNSLDALIAKKRLIKQGAMQELLTGKRRLQGFSQEWQVETLGQILERMSNGFTYKPSASIDYPITRIETISDGTINFDRTGFAEKDPALENYKLQAGDILFSHINSVDHIGKVAIYETDQTLYHGMNLLLLRVSASFSSKFLYYWLCSEIGRRISRKLAKQAVSQASINTSELKKVEINHPALPEQTAIAEILSDMDAEISALEQKREKTRLLKQGMMQELLTGRIRLV